MQGYAPIGSHALTLAETAAELRLSARKFRKIRNQLSREQGFPPPLPGLTPPRWSRALVTAWLAAGGSRPIANDNDGATAAVQRAREALRNRGK